MLMGVQDAQVKATETGMEPTVGPAGVKVISMAQLIDRDTAVVWRGPLKIKALKQMLSDVEWGDLDYLVIDLPPGTSDEPLSVAQEIPDADGAVVVTTPQQVSLLDVRKSIAFAKAVKMDILGVIENMSGFVCPHCGKQTDIFKVGGGEDAAKELGLPFLGRVPLDPRIVIGGDSGRPFVLEHRRDAVAWTAPLGPEIHEDETRFADLRIERRVRESNRPRPRRGHRLWGARGHQVPQLAGPNFREFRVVHGGEDAGRMIKGFGAA